jgi:hypothetical protein
MLATILWSTPACTLSARSRSAPILPDSSRRWCFNPPISIAALRHSKLTAPATIVIRAIDEGVFLHLLVLLVAFA